MGFSKSAAAETGFLRRWLISSGIRLEGRVFQQRRVWNFLLPHKEKTQDIPPLTVTRQTSSSLWSISWLQRRIYWKPMNLPLETLVCTDSF